VYHETKPELGQTSEENIEAAFQTLPDGLAIRYAHTSASSDRGFGDAEMFGCRMMFGTVVCGW
jgi:hypothetical protein